MISCAGFSHPPLGAAAELGLLCRGADQSHRARVKQGLEIQGFFHLDENQKEVYSAALAPAQRPWQRVNACHPFASARKRERSLSAPGVRKRPWQPCASE